MRRATRTMLAIASAVLLLAVGLPAQKADSAQALLRAATDKAFVDGDLKGAIKQFQTIVDKFKTDRAVVATALVQMAECYQKMGRRGGKEDLRAGAPRLRRSEGGHGHCTYASGRT